MAQGRALVGKGQAEAGLSTVLTADAAAFLTTAFFATDFFTAACFVGAFFTAAVFFSATFLTGVFLTAAVLAAVTVFNTVFFTGAFFTATVFFICGFRRCSYLFFYSRFLLGNGHYLLLQCSDKNPATVFSSFKNLQKNLSAFFKWVLIPV